MTVSMRAKCNSHGEDSSYFLGWQEYEKDPYDEVRNPSGVIQMGLAENQLSFDLLESWLAENPEPAGFKRDGESIFRELALFQDYHGLPNFKNALAQFMAEIRGNKVNFNPTKLVLTAGATSANETLMFCLADPGEAFLVPTPYYPGFDRDLSWRTGVEIIPIQCDSSNGFRITGPALDEAYRLSEKSNLRVKGILVTNPSNPLGTTLTRHELHLLLNFAHSKGIHLVSDEIYSGTVLGLPGFVSALEVLTTEKYDRTDLQKRVHVVYSLSKDLGLPGFRIGSIYSNDPLVVAAATKMSSFGLVSSQTQYLLSAMLSDKKFVKSYVFENRRRLQNRQGMLVHGLEKIGVSCLESNAGLFCWVDMRHLLGSHSFEGEMEVWRKIVYEVGLNVSAGSSFHCVEPGWFRVCFANMSEEVLGLAVRRLRAFVSRPDGICRDLSRGSRRNGKSFSKWVFRLSFHGQESEQ